MAAELDWKRIGLAVAHRRAELGFRKQDDAAKAAGIGVTTWRQIEGAKQDSYRPVILAAVALALNWPADALEKIGRGEPPLDAPTLGELEARIARLEAEIAARRPRQDHPEDA